MKSEGFGNIEIVGNVTKIKSSGGYLIMNIDTTTPVGWHVNAALTHRDLIAVMKQMLKPSNLLYLFFGFARPNSARRTPNYEI